MSRRQIRSFAALAVAASLALSACSSSSSSSATPSGTATTPSVQAQTVTILQNWFAQAEQAGYWDASSKQYAKAQGITINAQQGGPGVQTIPQVAAGKSEFGVANADEILVARKSGLPIVAIAAGFDTNLQCMMSHKDANITNFAGLNGHQVAAVPSPYFDFLKAHFKLTSIKQVNFNGSMATFKLNKNLVQQCFVTSEPFVAQQQSIAINYLSVAKDGGYNPYGNLLFTTEKVIKDNPELVRAVVSAVVQGWTDFLADPSVAKAAVIAANKDVDPAGFDYAATAIKDGNYLGSPIGGMTDARWKTLRDQLVSVGDLPANFDYTPAFTTQFLPAN
jgi:NitT/TauT family transport system substrate-binding protein